MRAKADWNLLYQEIAKIPLGTRRIVSHSIFSEDGHRYVTVRCKACRETRNLSVDSIRAGKSLNCHCQPHRKYHDPRAKVLQDRYYAIQQRCENPNSQSWSNYGGRGIENRFTPQSFVEYVLKALPHPDYRGVEIGRIDNDGHYEPGNLELVTKQENAWNTQRTVWVKYRGDMLPAVEVARRMKQDLNMSLCVTRATLLLCQGVPWREVLKRRGRGPYRRRGFTTS
jgi:hypothetical protein